MKSFVFGHSASGIAIPAHKFGHSGPHVLILGGVHGDEPEGVIACQGLFEAFTNSFPYQMQVTLVPIFNMDGVLKNQRKNSNGVDLNRNLPSNDWTSEVSKDKYHPGTAANSEPENQALVDYLKLTKPKLVYSMHSFENFMLNINGNCMPEAKRIHELTNYKIEESIGYPTPGCLGTYCGLERNMPTITYELQRNMDTQDIIKTHVPAILDALKITETT